MKSTTSIKYNAPLQPIYSSLLKCKRSLYICAFVSWIILIATSVNLSLDNIIGFVDQFNNNIARGIVLTTIILLYTIIFYLWAIGSTSIWYNIFWFVFKRSDVKIYQAIINTDASCFEDKVVVLYCTFNDFNPQALLTCMQQDYTSTKYIILDDSTQIEYRQSIDEFCNTHNIQVVRRADNIGFKAGNINNFLQQTSSNDWDYFVLLDSDEIIPPDFVTQSLKYFHCVGSQVGILQANHIAINNRNTFTRLFHLGVNTCWSSLQWMKSRYGFQCLLGHGAMISRACYQAVGGFPHIVAEDIGFTLLARKAGYKIVFAPNIICGEEFPVDYLAFRKRQSKWTLGNLEFTKKFLISSIASNKFNLTWCEKLDLLFGPFALIFSTIGIGLLIIAEIVFRFLEFKFDGIFDYFFIIPSTIFVISPMIMDITTWYKLTWYRYLTYIFASIVLYSGIIFVSAYYIILGLCGKKPKFVVTPKEEYNTYFKVAIKSYLPDIIFWQ